LGWKHYSPLIAFFSAASINGLSPHFHQVHPPFHPTSASSVEPWQYSPHLIAEQKAEMQASFAPDRAERAIQSL
jgi:hypothetical protein